MASTKHNFIAISMYVFEVGGSLGTSQRGSGGLYEEPRLG
jgi:hypothetical protein